MDAVTAGGLAALLTAGTAALAIAWSVLRTPEVPLHPDRAALRRGLGLILASFAAGLTFLGLDAAALALLAPRAGGSTYALPVGLSLGLVVGVAAWSIAVTWRSADEAFAGGDDAGRVRRQAILRGVIGEAVGVLAAVGLFLGVVAGG